MTAGGLLPQPNSICGLAACGVGQQVPTAQGSSPAAWRSVCRDWFREVAMVRPAIEPIAGGIRIRLRVTPGADRDRIEGMLRRDDGSEMLGVRVRAVPDRGRANSAVVLVLAEALGVPKTSICVVGGATSRLKLVEIAGDADKLLAAIADRL